MVGEMMLLRPLERPKSCWGRILSTDFRQARIHRQRIQPAIYVLCSPSRKAPKFFDCLEGNDGVRTRWLSFLIVWSRGWCTELA